MTDNARPPTPGGGTPPDDFVTLQQAAALLGVSRYTVAAIIKREGWTVYERGGDRRVRWLRRADVERLMQARPAAGPKEEAA